MTIQRGDESEELDIENDIDEDTFGEAPFSESDAILPSADSVVEQEERDALREATLDNTPKPKEEEEEEEEEEFLSEAQKSRLDLLRENQDLRQQAMCNVCMDSYAKPHVSIACWHVHCKQCWLRALGAKKLCPQCKVIVTPKDLRKIYL